jgi:hypothetical protein
MSRTGKVMLILLVLVLGGMVIYGAFMLTDIASIVSQMKPRLLKFGSQGDAQVSPAKEVGASRNYRRDVAPD